MLEKQKSYATDISDCNTAGQDMVEKKNSSSPTIAQKVMGFSQMHLLIIILC